jgi:hypothetical protein
MACSRYAARPNRMQHGSQVHACVADPTSVRARSTAGRQKPDTGVSDRPRRSRRDAPPLTSHEGPARTCGCQSGPCTQGRPSVSSNAKLEARSCSRSVHAQANALRGSRPVSAPHPWAVAHHSLAIALSWRSPALLEADARIAGHRRVARHQLERGEAAGALRLRLPLVGVRLERGVHRV